MKTTPIYILLIIFFLNFDLAWGLSDDEPMPKYNLQYLYTLNYNNYELFHSLNITYTLNSNNFMRFYNKEKILTIHRLRLNLGMSKILTEIDYDVGINFKTSDSFYIMPYANIGTSIYSFAYGAGFELNFIPNVRKSEIAITGNLNYRSTVKLFGRTDAQQWYQSGFGARIGITTAIR